MGKERHRISFKGIMLGFAPSSTKSESSFNEVNSFYFSDGKPNKKVIFSNFRNTGYSFLSTRIVVLLVLKLLGIF